MASAGRQTSGSIMVHEDILKINIICSLDPINHLKDEHEALINKERDGNLDEKDRTSPIKGVDLAT